MGVWADREAGTAVGTGGAPEGEALFMIDPPPENALFFLPFSPRDCLGGAADIELEGISNDKAKRNPQRISGYFFI